MSRKRKFKVKQKERETNKFYSIGQFECSVCMCFIAVDRCSSCLGHEIIGNQIEKLTEKTRMRDYARDDEWIRIEKEVTLDH